MNGLLLFEQDRNWDTALKNFISARLLLSLLYLIITATAFTLEQCFSLSTSFLKKGAICLPMYFLSCYLKGCGFVYGGYFPKKQFYVLEFISLRILLSPLCHVLTLCFHLSHSDYPLEIVNIKFTSVC